jgi:hypothetical protein
MSNTDHQGDFAETMRKSKGGEEDLFRRAPWPRIDYDRACFGANDAPDDYFEKDFPCERSGKRTPHVGIEHRTVGCNQAPVAVIEFTLPQHGLFDCEVISRSPDHDGDVKFVIKCNDFNKQEMDSLRAMLRWVADNLPKPKVQV